MESKRIYEASTTIKGYTKTVHNHNSPIEAVNELLAKYPNTRMPIRVSYVHESNVAGMVISCFQAPVLKAKKRVIMKLVQDNLQILTK